MDSPVRQQQKRNDYLRHKLFRKINRRRRAKRQQEIEAPVKELKKRLRQKRTFEDGKDGQELPYPLRTSRDYDDNLAYQSGLTRDPKTGHMMSTTQEEYPKERTYLKTPSHPTYSLAVWGDKLGGYDVYNRNGKTYSAPTFSELMYTKPPFKYAGGKDGDIITNTRGESYRIDPDLPMYNDDGTLNAVIDNVTIYSPRGYREAYERRVNNMLQHTENPQTGYAPGLKLTFPEFDLIPAGALIKAGIKKYRGLSEYQKTQIWPIEEWGLQKEIG